MAYLVYKHTNKINGKGYIGLTQFSSANIRWQNGKGYKKQKYFYATIKKDGWENFVHKILFVPFFLLFFLCLFLLPLRTAIINRKAFFLWNHQQGVNHNDQVCKESPENKPRLIHFGNFLQSNQSPHRQ